MSNSDIKIFFDIVALNKLMLKWEKDGKIIKTYLITARDNFIGIFDEIISNNGNKYEVKYGILDRDGCYESSNEVNIYKISVINQTEIKHEYSHTENKYSFEPNEVENYQNEIDIRILH